jgi:3-oxoadipate enol-lactonase
VSALVLVDALLPDRESAGVEAFDAAEGAALERGDLDAAVELNLRMWVDGRRPAGSAPPAVRERVAAMQRNAFAVQTAAAPEAEALVADAGARLGELRVPVLVLAGADDVADFLANADRLEREIPGARGARIAGAAHLPSLEKPAEFDALVLPFLADAAAQAA